MTNLKYELENGTVVNTLAEAQGHNYKVIYDVIGEKVHATEKQLAKRVKVKRK